MRCIYASASDGIHDQRWTAALRSLGFTVICVTRHPDEPGEHFRHRVIEAGGRDAVVLAGPLDTVAMDLIGLPAVVGLSWGFDLHRMTAEQRQVLASLSGLIVDSSATRSLAMDAGLPASALTFLPWGVDLTLFTPEGPTWQAPAGISPETPMVLSLRALEPLYRVEDVIRAFAVVHDTMPEAALVIGNDGSQRPALSALVRDLRLDTSVHWIGRIDETELSGLLRRADAYVSASEVDGTSVTLLQAMACACPAVASENAGNVDVLAEGRGRLFPVGDVRGLTSALLEVLSDPVPPVPALAWVRREADWQANLPRLAAAMQAAATT